MKFSVLATMFDKIAVVSSRLEMTRLLANLFEQATPKESQIICNLSLGMLRPSYQGNVFSIAEKSVLKVVADLFGEDVAVVTQRMKQLGDVGAVVLEGAWRATKDYDVEGVYEQLVMLETFSGIGSQEERLRALTTLLKEVDPLSAAYIVRIVVGKLRLGFSDMTLIDALSWMLVGNKTLSGVIEDAYNMCADIGYIAYVIKKDGIEGLKHVTITVGIPVRPAAAERLSSAQAIIDKLGTCAVQPKLDGFRVQVHIDNTHDQQHIHFFSRNLLEMSGMFPDLADALKHLSVKTLIAEGEAIVFDDQTGTFVPFQETVKRKRKHDIEEVAQQLPLKLYMFDILFLNGESVLSKTHQERRQFLATFLSVDSRQTVSLIEERIVSNAHDLEEYFEEQMDSGLEGVVVKKLNSVYQPGKRNFNWIKLKRQEGKELQDTVDAVVLGYYAGKGKRAQFGIGAFLIGVYNDEVDRFETVAKIGTGLSDEGWSDLKQRCDALKVKTQPHNVVCSKELFPDVWVVPELVCTVRADDITRSPLHTAGKNDDSPGYALRFPRFISYRPDKNATQATSVKELIRLFELQYQ